MRRVISSTVVLILLGAVQVCFACDCINLSDKESFEQAHVVFEGEVVRIRELGLETEYTFKVYKSLKGSNTDNVVLFEGRTNCDKIFHPDQIYRVYARRFENKLSSGACVATRVLRSKPLPASMSLTTPNWLDRNKELLVIIGLTFTLSLLVWFIRKSATRRT